MVTKPRIDVTFALVLGFRVSKILIVAGIPGVGIVVTFGLVSGLRVSKISSQRSWWSRNTELTSFLDSPLEGGKERGERRKKR